MEQSEDPQQTVCNLEGLVFFSNFDSGNLAKVQKTGVNTFELVLSPDAASKGCSSYKSWFFFGIRGLKKGMYIRLSIVNLGFCRPFNSPVYRPVFRCLPAYPEWQRIQSETIFEPISTNQYKFTWSFEALASENDHFFAYSTPYPYCDILRNMSLFEKMCPYDCIFHREILTRSLDGREVELITISNKSNFSYEREERVSGLFPSSNMRAYKSTKPIIYISARVHPGETPASFLLDGILLTILANDSRGSSLRNNFVFKIIPVLNPDGVFRGNFRLDQNGNNLNRYYLDPSPYLHPTIYASKHYFLSLTNIKYYLDLHAHNSKRSCFLFGNYLGCERQPENQIYAKLIELNTPYFELNECDFSEKSMSAKDPKDQHSKEGSGRVALYNSTGLIHTYTIECSYYMLRPLHTVAQTISSKSGKRFNEPNYNSSFLIPVHNRNFFNDFGIGLLMAILDLECCNPNSRIPFSEFRTLESIRDYLKARNLIQNRMISKNLFRNDPNKNERFFDKGTLPKLPLRKIHKMNIISPNFNSVPQTLYQKPKALLAARGKSLLRE